MRGGFSTYLFTNNALHNGLLRVFLSLFFLVNFLRLLGTKKNFSYFHLFSIPSLSFAFFSWHSDISLKRWAYILIIPIIIIYNSSVNFTLPVPPGKWRHGSCRNCAETNCKAQSKPNTVTKAVTRYLFFISHYYSIFIIFYVFFFVPHNSFFLPFFCKISLSSTIKNNQKFVSKQFQLAFNKQTENFDNENSQFIDNCRQLIILSDVRWLTMCVDDKEIDRYLHRTCYMNNQQEVVDNFWGISLTVSRCECIFTE